LQTLALPLGHRAPGYSVLADALPDFSAQNDCLSNFFHWSLFLRALELQSHEDLVFGYTSMPVVVTKTSFPEGCTANAPEPVLDWHRYLPWRTRGIQLCPKPSDMNNSKRRQDLYSPHPAR